MRNVWAALAPGQQRRVVAPAGSLELDILSSDQTATSSGERMDHQQIDDNPLAQGVGVVVSGPLSIATAARQGEATEEGHLSGSVDGHKSSDEEGEETRDSEDEDNLQYCDFDCGYSDISSAAVRQHERGCERQHRCQQLHYGDIMTFTPVWRWRAHALWFVLFCIMFQWLEWRAVLVASDLACDDAHRFYALNVTANETASNKVSTVVSRQNGIAGLRVSPGPGWSYQSLPKAGGVTISNCEGPEQCYGRASCDGWIAVNWFGTGEVGVYRCGPEYDLNTSGSTPIRRISTSLKQSKTGAKLASESSSKHSCKTHNQCAFDEYCNGQNRCRSCSYIDKDSACDAIKGDCSSPAFWRQCPNAPSVRCSANGGCITLHCSEIEVRTDIESCHELQLTDCSKPIDITNFLDSDGNGMKVYVILYYCVRGLIGLLIFANSGPWIHEGGNGISLRESLESKLDDYNGPQPNVSPTGLGPTGRRSLRSVTCLRQWCVSCPRLSPDRQLGLLAKKWLPTKWLPLLKCSVRNRSRLYFDQGLLMHDEELMRQALSMGLDIHTDILGRENPYKIERMFLSLMSFFLYAGWLDGSWMFLGIVFFGSILCFFQKCVCKRCCDSEEKQKFFTESFSKNDTIDTSRPPGFVLPLEMGTPLVLAALCSNDFLQLLLSRRDAVHMTCEQQHCALRLALLTHRFDNAESIAQFTASGIDSALDADGRTVLQWLAHQLVAPDGDLLLSFCRGRGLDKPDFVHRCLESGVWARRVEGAISAAIHMGANVQTPDSTGSTPLHNLIQSCEHQGEHAQMGTCDLLVEHGADLHAEINDEGGHTTTASMATTSEYANIREWGRSVGSYAGRFQLLDQIHRSESCVVFKGRDLLMRRPQDNMAAVKIMRRECEWQREISTRTEYNLDSSHVVGIRMSLRVDAVERSKRLRWIDKASSSSESEYVIAMSLGECSLFDAVHSERRVGRDVNFARRSVIDIAACLQHLHESGVCHCDVKTRNFCRFKTTDGVARLKLIDMDAATALGTQMQAWGAGLKASTAYAPPELVAHVLLGDREPPISLPTLDAWSVGAILFELCTGIPLFNADRSDDNLNDEHSKVQLLNWRTIDSSRLQLVFAECAEILDRQKEDAKNLISWCLQADAARRPTMQQILAHRFVVPDDASPPMQVPSICHFFLSHFQKEAADLVRSLFLMLEKSGCSCWLDMEAENLTLEGMRQGVAAAECFVLVLTKGVLFRPYCIEEIFMAVKLRKPVVLIVEQDPKYSPWSYEDWRNECTGVGLTKQASSNTLVQLKLQLQKAVDCDDWDLVRTKSNELVDQSWTEAGSDYKWCRAELAKVEQRGDAAAQGMMDAVAELIEAHRHKLIPYRRRNFESTAMIYEILRRNNLYTVGSLSSSDAIQRIASAPPTLIGAQQQPAAAATGVPLDRIRTAPAAVETSEYLSIVSSGAAGSSVATQLQASLRTRGISVSVGVVQQCSRILFVLTNGALLDPQLMAHLCRSIAGEDIVRQRSARSLSNVDVTDLEVVHHKWSFGSEEQVSVCTSHEAVAGLFQHQEFITYREPGQQSLQYEHEAMVDEIARRFTNRDRARSFAV